MFSSIPDAYDFNTDTDPDPTHLLAIGTKQYFPIHNVTDKKYFNLVQSNLFVACDYGMVLLFNNITP